MTANVQVSQGIYRGSSCLDLTELRLILNVSKVLTGKGAFRSEGKAPAQEG